MKKCEIVSVGNAGQRVVINVLPAMLRQHQLSTQTEMEQPNKAEAGTLTQMAGTHWSGWLRGVV